MDYLSGLGLRVTVSFSLWYKQSNKFVKICRKRYTGFSVFIQVSVFKKLLTIWINSIHLSKRFHSLYHMNPKVITNTWKEEGYEFILKWQFYFLWNNIMAGKDCRTTTQWKFLWSSVSLETFSSQLLLSVYKLCLQTFTIIPYLLLKTYHTFDA